MTDFSASLGFGVEKEEKEALLALSASGFFTLEGGDTGCGGAGVGGGGDGEAEEGCGGSASFDDSSSEEAMWDWKWLQRRKLVLKALLQM